MIFSCACLMANQQVSLMILIDSGEFNSSAIFFACSVFLAESFSLIKLSASFFVSVCIGDSHPVACS
jgi:hypothetical protein